MTTATLPLGDPVGMRSSIARFWNGYLGAHKLADGRVVWCIWPPISQTHNNIYVWDAKESWEVKNVCRLQCAYQTEQLFQKIES